MPTGCALAKTTIRPLFRGDHRRTCWTLLASATLAVATTGCAVGASPLTPPARDALAYSTCMRAHGVPDFPDPKGGGFQENGTPTKTIVNGVTLKENPARLETASQACRQYLGTGGRGGSPSPQLRAAALAFATCMRAHGIANFPDPQVSGHSIRSAVPAGDAKSPLWQAARRACRSLVPHPRQTRTG